jgi:hypothetical protein
VRPRTARGRPESLAWPPEAIQPLEGIPLEILLLAWDELDDWLAAGLQLLRRLS